MFRLIKILFVVFPVMLFGLFCFADNANAASNVFYSVGQSSTTDLMVGSPVITIASGTASFDIAQTGNIGVGDRITYNTNNIAYISGKISTSQWNVITATGSTPSDITSSSVVSIKRTFASLFEAEAGADDAGYLATSSLVGANVILNFPVYFDSTSDQTSVSINGYITGVNNYIRVYTPTSTVSEVNINQRHSGVWNSAKYNLYVPNNNGIIIGDNHVKIDGLQIWKSSSDQNGEAPLTFGASVVDADNKIEISNSILRQAGSDSITEPVIVINDKDLIVDIWNVIAYGGGDVNSSGNAAIYIATSTLTRIYSSTLLSEHNGIKVDGGTSETVIIKNTYVRGTGTGNSYGAAAGCSFTLVNAASSDGTGSAGLQNIAFSTANFLNTSTGTEDFHLTASSALLDVGTSTAGESEPLNFTTDIDGETRSGIWDIGADEGMQVLTQKNYRFYYNSDSIQPTQAVNSENASATIVSTTTNIRLRMNVSAAGKNLATSSQAFKLQYSNSTSSGWSDVGSFASTTAWRFFDSPSITDGTSVSAVLLSSSSVVEMYLESNSASTNPVAVLATSSAEYDFSLDASNATGNTYYFRLVESDETALNAYDNYPAITVTVPGWHNSSWPYRKQISIDSTKVSGTSSLYNFPMLISLASDSGLSASATTSGNDILFTSDNGTAKLPHEIEYYASSTGQLIAWVNVPQLNSASQSTSTVIYMYYGNSGATSQQNATGTWDSNYRGVWHLNQTSTSSGKYILDSTVNANNGSSSGSYFPTATSSGKIDGAQYFNASTINSGSDSSIDDVQNQGYGGMTISMWLNSATITTAMIMGKGGASDAGRWYVQRQQNTDPARIAFIKDGDTDLSVRWYTILGSEEWTHLVLTWDGTNATSGVYLYKNGVSMIGNKTNISAGVNLYSDASNSLDFGSAALQPYSGSMDEMRISNKIRSVAWIATEYANQSTPSAFYIVGEVVSLSTSTDPVLTQIHYRWRNNDGNEAEATFAVEADNAITDIQRGQIYRLRVSLKNTGSGSASASQYRLEYANSGGGACSGIATTSWISLINTGLRQNQDFSLVNVSNALHLSSTTDVSVNGGIDNDSLTFSSGQFVSDVNLTSAFALAGSRITELEYSMWPEASALASTTYCFRLLDQTGGQTISYTVYPQIIMAAIFKSLGGGSVYEGAAVSVSNVTSSEAVLGGDNPSESPAPEIENATTSSPVFGAGELAP